MKIFQKITLLILLAVLLIQCSNENNFNVEKGKVGLLSTETKVQDLDIIFSNDSIVNQFSRLSLINGNDEYEIFSKNGNKLLEIVPVKQNDSSSKLKSIQIFDSNYKTDKGVGLASNFEDIKNSYSINKIETTLSSATLYIDELNATISFDKEELGISKFSTEEITVEQIPGVSKIKYFTIWFN